MRSLRIILISNGLLTQLLNFTLCNHCNGSLPNLINVNYFLSIYLIPSLFFSLCLSLCISIFIKNVIIIVLFCQTILNLAFIFLSIFLLPLSLYLSIYLYIYIYINVCVCVCVCEYLLNHNGHCDIPSNCSINNYYQSVYFPLSTYIHSFTLPHTYS